MKKLIIPLILFITLLPGCITVNMGNPVSQPPSAFIDQVIPANAVTGDTVSFTGHGTDSDGTITAYQWRSSLDGILSTAATFQSSSLSAGTHIIYFKVMDNSNNWSPEASATVIISTKATRPVIDYFTASTSTIYFGQSVELNWKVSGGGTVSIDNGVGQVSATGSKVLFPVTNTVYTLTATNPSGSVTSAITVIVQQQSTNSNPVISFTAQHMGGTSWQLNWNVQNANQISIEPEIGEVPSSGSKVVTVPSGQVKSYKLMAKNSWGWAYWTVTMATP